MSQKSYDNRNGVYLIPTPIGNLDDISYRIVETLKKVDVIFSEDTRITNELLKHFDIKKTLISSHQYNEFQNVEKAKRYLDEGKNIGIVTDRGTPIISDPGYPLTKSLIEEGYKVIALPGPTAFVPALIVSGIDPQPFYFHGFLNSKESKRKKELEDLKKIKAALIFYEAPHRIEKTLNNIKEILGNRKISISREITKKYEEIYRGNVSDVLEEIKDAKGEMVIIVDGNHEENNFENLTITEHVNLYIREGKEKKEAMKIVAKERNISKSKVYKEYLKEGE